MPSTCPNFLYIGTAKAGSTWLFEALREHPEVFVPIAKDIYFFDRYFDRGAEWYNSYFSPATQQKAIGELSHDYFLSEVTAQRIYELLPNSKLIACLRDPVSQLASQYRFRQAGDLHKNIDFQAFLNAPKVRAYVEYYKNLQPFFDRFPSKNILILFYEDLQQDTKQFVRSVYEFLEVDTGFVPSVLNQRILGAREPKSYLVAKLAYRTAHHLKNSGFGNLVGAVKRSPLVNNLLFGSDSQKTIFSKEIEAELYSDLSAQYLPLQELIGKEIPPVWWRRQ